MTRLRIAALFGLTVFLLSTASPSVPGATNAAPQHGFSFKEYEEFHDVLHPLEHDALPKKDYRRLYPAEYFMFLDLPQEIERALSQAA